MRQVKADGKDRHEDPRNSDVDQKRTDDSVNQGPLEIWFFQKPNERICAKNKYRQKRQIPRIIKWIGKNSRGNDQKSTGQKTKPPIIKSILRNAVEDNNAEIKQEEIAEMPHKKNWPRITGKF